MAYTSNVSASLDMNHSVRLTPCVPDARLRLPDSEAILIAEPFSYQQLIEALPSATVCDIDGPHLLLQSRPQECARQIRAVVETTG